MHRLLPAVNGSTAGFSLPLDLGQIHSLFVRAFLKEKRHRFVYVDGYVHFYNLNDFLE